MNRSRPKAKRSRALGIPLTPKCVKYFERRPYPPGAHGRGRKQMSDYKTRLLEKQRLRAQYDVSERQLRRAFDRSARGSGKTGEALIADLETRLDALVLYNKARPPVRRPAVQDGCGRYLREAERLHIADRLREGASLRAIAAELGRSPSTISREVRRNRQPATGVYRPHAAQARADARRPRPRPGRLATNEELRGVVQGWLEMNWSPEQIAIMLRKRFPDQPEMYVSHETIYQALYVQGRGQLRRELVQALRTGRTYRKPRRQAQQRNPRYTAPMVMISERPAEAADRAVPGHWEGDLIIGKNQTSQIGTLVERATRYLLLVHLPADRTAQTVRDALAATMQTLPAELKRSLTWDQGAEMALHHEFAIAADLPVYFCDPHSPWQRGSNENTNGLLRQYFPKGTDLSAHTREHLDAVAAELNSRPRKTLGWQTPAERLTKLLTPAS